MNKYFILLALLLVSANVFSQQEKPDALKMYNDGRFTEAIEICKKELKEMPRNMDSYAVLCWSLVSLNRYQEALDEARKALQIAPYDHRIIKITAEALFHLGQNQESLSYYEKYVSIFPGSEKIADVYYEMGEIFIRLARYNNADIALSAAVRYNSKNARWFVRLGYAREMAGDYKYAIEAYESALKLNAGLQDAIRGIESARQKMAAE